MAEHVMPFGPSWKRLGFPCGTGSGPPRATGQRSAFWHPTQPQRQNMNQPQFWKDELLREDIRLRQRLVEDGARHLVNVGGRPRLRASAL
jgi:hypothetical protein